MSLFKSTISLEGDFSNLPQEDLWQLECSNGLCYLVENPQRVPIDRSPSFKVYASFATGNCSKIRILKTKPLSDQDEHPNYDCILW
jgi:hypothetical protein